MTLTQNLATVDETAFLLGGPFVHDAWPSTVEAIADLIQLWFWRDVRFWVGDAHLNDWRRPPAPPARRARELAVDALGQDFAERGGVAVELDDDFRTEAYACPVHGGAAGTRIEARPGDPILWPSGAMDRRLCQAAFQAGCHVFLTEDRGVLKRHAHLRGHGLAVLTPRSLLEALDASGELEPLGTAFPFPDTAAFARFYALRSPDDDEDWGVDAART